MKRFFLKWFFPFLGAFSAIWLLLLAGNQLIAENWMLKSAFIHSLLLSAGAAMLSMILRYYRPVGFQLLNLGIWIIITAAAIIFGSEGLLHGFDSENAWRAADVRALRFAIAILLLLCIALITWVNRQGKREMKSMVRYNDMKQLARDAELNTLRQQLQPHFLFNSLNSIQALIGSQPDKARNMLIQLSDYLRGTLKKGNDAKHTVAEEVENSLLYLNIEKTRFGDRLQVGTDFNMEDKEMKRRIPALILQPIVENAVKHGLYQTSGPVTITMQVMFNSDDTIFEISNPFDPNAIANERGTGFGLSSLKRRLFLLYGKEDLVKTEQSKESFITRIQVPVS